MIAVLITFSQPSLRIFSKKKKMQQLQSDPPTKYFRFPALASRERGMSRRKDHLSLTLPLAPCVTLTLTTKAGPQGSLVSGS